MTRESITGLVITGGFAVVFLGWGVLTLSRGRATGVNPDHPSSMPHEFALLFFRRNPNQLEPQRETIELTGAAAARRAALYLVMGAAFAALFAATLILRP